MATKTAELVLRLIDQVTGPARGMVSALNSINKATALVSGSARNMRRSANDMAAFSLPLLAIGTDAAQQVFEFEKVGNAIEAVTGMAATSREELEAMAQVLNSKFPASNVDILGGMLELGKSGMDLVQIRGSIENVLQLAQAGDFGIQDSSSILISTATALRMAMDTELNAAESTKKVADTLAFAANKSLADIPDLGVTLKYVAAAAAATNMDIETLGASVTVLANNGIMGSNAGTGLRYALLQLINPSKQANAAFAKLGINLGDFVSGAEKVNAQDLVGNLALDGIDISGVGLDAIQKILDDPAIAKSPAMLAAKLTPMITDAIGSDGLLDDTVLAESLSKSLSLLGTNVDLQGLMNAFRENPQSEALFGAIFGKQHAVKMMALLAGDLDGMIEAFREESTGAAERMSEVRMKGIVGQWYEMTAAIENLYLRIADSGVLADAAMVIDKIAVNVQAMADLNPDLLKFGTYALLATAGLAPLGWALSGIAASVAFMANPITIVVGALAFLAYQNWDGVQTFFNKFQDAYRTYLNPEALKSVGDTLNIIRTALSGIGKGIDFGGAGSSLGQFFAQLINDIPSFIEEIDGLSRRMRPTIMGMVRFFDRLGEVIGKVAQALGKIGLGAWDGIVNGIAAFSSAQDQGSIDQLNNWANSLARFALAKNDADASLVDQAASNMPSWLSQLGTKFGESTGGMTSNTVRELEFLGSKLQETGSKMAGMWSGFSAGYDWAVMDIRLKFREFITWLKGVLASTSLWDAGVAMIQSLWDGMKAKFGELMGWAGGIGGQIGAALAGAVGAGGPAPGTGGPSVPSSGPSAGLPTPGYAKGGSYQPGLIVTGEKGAELQVASGRGQVFNAKDTRDMLMNRGKGGGDTFNLHVYGGNTEEVVAKVSAYIDSKLQRSRGLAMDDRYVSE